MAVGEHGTVIFIACFCLVTTITFNLAIFSSPWLFIGYEEQSEVTVPLPWRFSDLSGHNYTSWDNQTVFYPVYDILGFQDFTLTVLTTNDTTIGVAWQNTLPPFGARYIEFNHVHYSMGLGFYYEMNPSRIYYNDLIEHSNGTEISQFTISCSEGDLICSVQITFDNSHYNNFLEAWLGGELQVFIGYSSVGTEAQWNTDAWNLVTSVLSFNAFSYFPPELEPISDMISIIIWIGIAVMIMYVISKVKPF